VAVEAECHLAAVEFCGARQDRKRLGRQAGAVLYPLKLAALLLRPIDGGLKLVGRHIRVAAL